MLLAYLTCLLWSRIQEALIGREQLLSCCLAVFWMVIPMGGRYKKRSGPIFKPDPFPNYILRE